MMTLCCRVVVTKVTLGRDSSISGPQISKRIWHQTPNRPHLLKQPKSKTSQACLKCSRVWLNWVLPETDSNDACMSHLTSSQHCLNRQQLFPLGVHRRHSKFSHSPIRRHMVGRVWRMTRVVDWMCTFLRTSPSIFHSNTSITDLDRTS
jgi:hypothetical protein